jgi:hypothetical protein
MSPSISSSTGPTLSGPGLSPSVDDDESTAEDDVLMARLNRFVSVRDLQNNPGCILLDFTGYRPIYAAHELEDNGSVAQVHIDLPFAAHFPPTERGRLSRGAKVNMGYTENHAMQSNIPPMASYLLTLFPVKVNFYICTHMARATPTGSLPSFNPRTSARGGGTDSSFKSQRVARSLRAL